MESNLFVTLAREIEFIDIDNAVNMIGGSEELYEKTLKQFASSIPGHVEQMDACLSELERFAGKAHSMRGVLVQVGCFELARLAESLEKAARERNFTYCADKYTVFKEQIVNLYKRLAEIMAKTQPEVKTRSRSDISHYYKALTEARQAAVNYDSISAAEHLAPLKDENFGGHIDELVAKAIRAIEMFRPQEAYSCISELLQECDEN